MAAGDASEPIAVTVAPPPTIDCDAVRGLRMRGTSSAKLDYILSQIHGTKFVLASFWCFLTHFWVSFLCLFVVFSASV